MHICTVCMHLQLLNYAFIDFLRPLRPGSGKQSSVVYFAECPPNTNINMIHRNYVFQLINAAIVGMHKRLMLLVRPSPVPGHGWGGFKMQLKMRCNLIRHDESPTSLQLNGSINTRDPISALEKVSLHIKTAKMFQPRRRTLRSDCNCILITAQVFSPGLIIMCWINAAHCFKIIKN